MDNSYCINCKYWYFDSGWGGTDVTPGDQWESYCNKGHWQCEGVYVREDEYRSYLLKSRECKDFKHIKEE